MKYRIEDAFETSTERYWQAFFDEEYNRALFDALDMDYALLELERRGQGADLVIDRRMRLTPRREVPRVLRKFVKDAVTYVETDAFTARDDSMDVVTVPTFMADRITTTGRYWLEARDPGTIARIFAGVVECRVPVVARAIERTIIAEIEDTYRRATAFTRKWLREHGD